MYIIVKYITSSVFNLYNMVGAVIYSSSQGNNVTAYTVCGAAVHCTWSSVFAIYLLLKL